MKKFYVVHNGEAKVVDTKTLNSYPFVSEAAKEPSDTFSQDWHEYNASSTQWCVAYAEDGREAV